MTKSSLFIQLLGVVQLGLNPNSEQKAENIFVIPPYSQAACSSNTLEEITFLVVARGSLFKVIAGSHESLALSNSLLRRGLVLRATAKLCKFHRNKIGKVVKWRKSLPEKILQL